MIPRPPLPDGPYLIVGLARSGVAAARMLREHGEVLAVDSGRPDVPDDLPAQLESDGLDLLEGAACVVKSPGVPAQAPVIATARERGLPVLGEDLRRRETGAGEPDDEDAGSSERRRRAQLPVTQLPVNRRKSR